VSRVEIRELWQQIENRKRCNKCPLKDKSRPLLFKPKNRVRVLVVTEGPNEEAEPDFIASIANHPTFTFLQALFRGKFQPIGEEANVYWTHLRKCFLKIGNKRVCNSADEDKALKNCSSQYLEKEINAVKPKLILAVGGKATWFLRSISKDRRLRGNLKNLIFEKGGIFNNVKIGEAVFDVCVVPHPSGKNTSWTKLPPNAKEVLENISAKIVSTASSA